MDNEMPVNSENTTVSFWKSRTFKKLLISLFWVWYLIGVALFLWDAKNLESLWPVSLSVVWWGVYLLQKPLQEWSKRIHLPLALKYFVLGVFFFDVIMESFAVSWKGDLHPNIILSDILWLGGCFGVLIAWWILAHIYKLTPWQVFFLYGLKGVIVEQNYMLPLLLLKGEIAPVLIWGPYVLVVYAAAIAPVFLILQPELPKTTRKLGIGGVFLAFFVPTALFYGGSGVWFKIMEYFFHLK